MNFNDERYIDYFYDLRKRVMKEHPLRFLFFEITSRCNAHCEHCGSSCGDFIPKDEITTEEIKGVLKSIADHEGYDPRQIMLNITGGEPLVRKDLFEVMGYAHELGYNWGMVSNGMLLTPEIVDKMVKAGIYSVSISIDGLKETHEKFRGVPGSWEKIMNGIKLMLQRPEIGVVQTITCVNKKNIDQLEDLYKLMVELGIKDWRVMEVDPIGRAKNNKELLLDEDDFRRMFEFILEKRKNKDGMTISYGCGHFLGDEYEEKMRAGTIPFLCSAGTFIGSVLSNGDIFVCPDVERRPEFIQGNIRVDDFVDVWENKFKEFRKISRTCNSKCKNCTDWKRCAGDAFHTWDFDANEPRFCIHEVLASDYQKKKVSKSNKSKTQSKKKTTKK